MSRADKFVIGAILGYQAIDIARRFFFDAVQTSWAADCAADRKALSPAALTALQRDGVAILDAGLSPQQLSAARTAAVAKIEHMSAEHGNAANVRSDHVTWVRQHEHSDREAQQEGLSPCITLLRGLGAELDEGAPHYVRTTRHRVPLDLQLSCYDGGDTFYAPHRDNPSLNELSITNLGLKGWLEARHYRTRAVTALLYLNEQDWSDEDGGALRVYVDAEPDDMTGSTATRVLSIKPTGGTLVLFDSHSTLHEVMPTKRQRFAISCWLQGERSTDAADTK